MADTQITILGMSGSGKTCYLLGLYYKMGAGYNGFTITTNNDTDVQLRDRYARLCDITLSSSERFPTGTDNIEKYEFQLRYGFNPIMSFDWVDYPGGLLDRKNIGNNEEFEEIRQHINNSACLFICVDGSLLMGNDIKEKIDNVRNNCSNVINTFFSDYLKNNLTLPPTAIIVTKYDMCIDDTPEDEMCEIIKDSFSPFFVKDEYEKIVSIIPVSLGYNIMDDNCSGKLNPMNIHLPIFMGIWFALIKKIQNTANEKKKIKHDKPVVAEVLSALLAPNKGLQNITKKNGMRHGKQKNKNKKNYELELMQHNRDNLNSELQKIKYTYKNGEIVSDFIIDTLG